MALYVFLFQSIFLKHRWLEMVHILRLRPYKSFVSYIYQFHCTIVASLWEVSEYLWSINRFYYPQLFQTDESFSPRTSIHPHTFLWALHFPSPNAFHMGGTVILETLSFEHPFACVSWQWCLWVLQCVMVCSSITKNYYRVMLCIKLPEQSLMTNIMEFQ